MLGDGPHLDESSSKYCPKCRKAAYGRAPQSHSLIAAQFDAHFPSLLHNCFGLKFQHWNDFGAEATRTIFELSREIESARTYE